MFTTMTSKLGFPFSNLSPCNHKHESDQLLRANPTYKAKLNVPRGALGERSSVTAPNVFYL